MNIESYIVSIGNCEGPLIKSIRELLEIPSNKAKEIFSNSLSRYLDQLKESIYLLVEHPYVDRVYRNSYYNYFSSKLLDYPRDTVKLSFFDGKISGSDFRNEDKYKELKRQYRGFIVLRPTIKNIIGRNVVSPKALKNNNFICCTTKFHSTANFVKFKVDGFPHSSQDTETISCAETTLWAIMEYFGNKYPDYKPVLPSRIIEVLKRISTERQIPSRGLRIDQISYALREFDFGTRLYSRDDFGEDEFKRLFSCYIESGIPLIVAIHGNLIGHAILCVGHHNVGHDQIDHLTESINNKDKIAPDNFKFFDNDDIEKKFVFIDDNMPPFQQLLYSTPTGGYYGCHPDWRQCKITHFVAPLYHKIYLEAFEAKKFCRKFLFENFSIPNNHEIYLRFFLTSGRSLKNSLNFNNTFDADVKQLILETPLPKFVWVGEISNKELIKERKAEGLILVDATEADTSELKPLIFANYLNVLYSIDPDETFFSRKDISLPTFSIFTNNLK